MDGGDDDELGSSRDGVSGEERKTERRGRSVGIHELTQAGVYMDGKRTREGQGRVAGEDGVNAPRAVKGQGIDAVVFLYQDPKLYAKLRPSSCGERKLRGEASCGWSFGR
jgi:hypothetical protein